MNSPRTLRILLVEDEPGDAHLMQLALQQSGFAFELQCVQDGHAALAYLREPCSRGGLAQRPDLILLDIKMPGQNGLETLKDIKQMNAVRAIPVVIITTSFLDSDVVMAYRAGAAGYVTKPVDMHAFASAINTLCTYWCGLVRLPESQL